MHMHKNKLTLLLAAGLVSVTAWAQENVGGNPSAGETTGGRTEVSAAEVTRGYLRDEVVGIRPEVGILAFKDSLGNNTSRLAAGLEVEWNAISLMNNKDLKSWFIGPTTGLVYSHLGAPTSNFFGTNPSVVTDAGSNFLFIPANLKVGYTFGDNFRVAAHGGGNVTYRSVASSLNLGASSVEAGSVWKMFPNVGADVEFGLGKNIALALRPDLTITPGDDFFAGTLALGIPIS